MLLGTSFNLGATISSAARPQVADSGTAPRHRSEVITSADQLDIAAKDAADQAGDAAVVLKYLLYLVKELSGNTSFTQ